MPNDSTCIHCKGTGQYRDPDGDLEDCAYCAAPPAPAPAASVSREFTNELGNAIRITIEGPTSVSENILTPMEFQELRAAINSDMNYDGIVGGVADVWHEGSRAFYKAQILYKYEGVPQCDPDDYEPERAQYLKSFDTSRLSLKESEPSAASEREAFEAEVRCEETWGHVSLARDSRGDYKKPTTSLMWAMWQAARAALHSTGKPEVADPKTEGQWDRVWARRLIRDIKEQTADLRNWDYKRWAELLNNAAAMMEKLTSPADAPVAEPVALNALKLIATAAASEHQAEYMRGLARAALRKVGAECITAIESAAPSAAEPECLGAIRKALDPRDRFKPTPGEWVADGRKGWVHPNTVVRTSDSREEGGHDIVRVHADFNCTVGKSEYEWANATFVAACSPQNIRAMLGYIDNLQAALIGQQHSAEPAVLTLDQYKAAMLKLKVKPGSLLEGDGDSLWQISTVREKAVLWLAFKNWYRPAPQAPAEPAPVLDGWRMVCGDWRDERVAIHGPQGHIVSGLTTEQAAALIAAHGGQAQGEAS